MKTNKSIPIIVTSIFQPTVALKKFSNINNFNLIIAGDRKTPINWKLPNCDYISINEQYKKYSKFSKLVGENTYCRKMFGYLEAIKKYNPDFLYETDDDNLPYSFFPNFLLKPKTIPIIDIEHEASINTFNIYSLFTQKKIWPRGYPLSKITTENRHSTKIKTIFPLIQQSLTNLDTDVDAIYRLTNNKHVKFSMNKRYALNKYLYSPINTQNTLYYKKIFPLLYLPSTVNNRVTDTWSGYIKQRILWEINGNMIFLSPSVYQKRNSHNLIKDFSCELDLYQKTELLLENLNELKLSGNVCEMLLQTYKSLIKKGFFKKSELNILSQWLVEINENKR